MASMSPLASPLASTSPRAGDRGERATSSRCRVRGLAPRRVDARAPARVPPGARSAVAACLLRGPVTRGVGDAPAASAASRGVARAVVTRTGVEAVPTPRRRRGARRPVTAASAADAAADGGDAFDEEPTPERVTPELERSRDVASGANGVGLGASSYRFAVVSLVALALLLCNADRVIMSVAGVPLAAAHGWGAETLGLVQSSFLWGYTLTPLLGGVLADKIGGKNVLLAGIATWSVATALTPFAAAASLPALLLCRAVMGLGEGVALPCMNNITARWVPKHERSRAVAACMTGFQSGSVVGLLAAPAMLVAGGVSAPFLVFGVAGLVWAVVWFAAATAYPREALSERRVNAQELALIEEGGAVVKVKAVEAQSSEKSSETTTDSSAQKKKVSAARLFSAPPVLACVFANFVNNWGYFILLAWMPSYFKQVLGLDLAQSARFSALPWFAMAVCGAFAGAFADWLINYKNVSVTATRKITQGVGFVGPALGLLLLTKTTSTGGALFALTFAVGCTAFTQAGFLVNFQEIGPRYVGAMHGMANTAGSIAGIVSTYGAGVVLEATGSWNAVLRVTAFVYLAGAAVWLAFSTGERVFD